MSVATLMTIKGIDDTQLWTIRKVLDNIFEVSDSLKEENMDKYKCQRYLYKQRILFQICWDTL